MAPPAIYGGLGAYIEVTTFAVWNILSRVKHGSHVPFCERISIFNLMENLYCVVLFGVESREARTLGDDFGMCFVYGLLTECATICIVHIYRFVYKMAVGRTCCIDFVWDL